MAVLSVEALIDALTNITQAEYKELIKQSEQLRILKNLIKLDDLKGGTIVTKSEITNLIKAMEQDDKK